MQSLTVQGVPYPKPRLRSALTEYVSSPSGITGNTVFIISMVGYFLMPASSAQNILLFTGLIALYMAIVSTPSAGSVVLGADLLRALKTEYSLGAAYFPEMRCDLGEFSWAQRYQERPALYLGPLYAPSHEIMVPQVIAILGANNMVRLYAFSMEVGDERLVALEEVL